MKPKKIKATRLLSLLLALMTIILAVPLSGISVFAETGKDYANGDYEYEISENNSLEITENAGFDYDVPEKNSRTESGDFEYRIILDDGTAEITGYNGTASDLVIPSEIDGYKVTSIGSSAFESCTFLTDIRIPDSITSINGAGFSYCTSLVNIIVSSENVAYSDIDGVLFNKEQTELIRYPEGKNDVNYMIPYGVVRIGDDAFSNCESLTNIIIPDSVTTIGYRAFENCTSLTDITIPNSVTSIEGYAFSYCTALLDVVIPDSVTEIGLGVFSHCSSLISAKISNNITYLDGFGNCTSLKSITIPDSVTYIESYAFYNCTSLSEIDIPDSVKYIREYAFDNTAYYNNNSNWEDDVLYCGKHLIKARADITGNYKMKDDTVSIAERAFQDCSNLTGVIISDKVTFIPNAAFNSCKALKSIVIPDTVTNIGWGSFANCTSLESIHIPNSVTDIDLYAFSGCATLKTVIIPDTVSYLTQEVFANCTSLTHIFIPDSVTDIFYAFLNCPNLTIYGYAGTVAETYANENGFKFIALDKKVDSTTGISVAEKELDILPDGAEIKVEQLSAEDNKIIFDISLVKDGTQVQPNGEVTVKIPVPEGMDATLLKVYREEANGTFTDMNAYFANGYMVFTTDHFSKYIITAEEIVSTLKGDVNGDGTVDAADAVLVQRYDAGMITLNDIQLKAADVNSDGIADAADAVIIMRYDAGLISKL